MSSAAKLRYLGRGTAVAASAALVITSFGPTAFAAWNVPNSTQAGVTSVTEPNGTIGIVDTDAATVDNQGATLVQAGQNGQSIADVRLVIPNSFKSGDVIDLRLFDRSATEQTNGNTNAGPSTLVGFSAVPTVAVDGAYNDDTRVDPNTDATDKTNTEATAENPWAAVAGETGVAATAPGVKPTFSTQLIKSPAGQGNDIVRLTVNSDPSTGDPNAKWVVSLSDLKVDLGANVTPGELRLVPFARNVSGNTTVPGNWFFGNRDQWTTNDAAREIAIYTVPAYVSPVTISTANQDILSGAGAQSVGTLTVGETQAISLGDGTYRLNLQGASIANTLASVKAAVTGGGATEKVTVTDVQANFIEFRIDGADPTKKSTFTFDGVELSAATPGQIKWNLTGATMNEWLASYAGGGATPGTAPISIAGTQVAPSQIAFTGAGEQATVGQTPVVTTAATTGTPAVMTDATARNAIPASADGTYTDNGAAAVLAGTNAGKVTAEGRRGLAAYDNGGNLYYKVVNNNGTLELRQYASAADRTSNNNPTVVATVINGGFDLDTATADGTPDYVKAFSTAAVAGDEFNVVNSNERAITFQSAVPGAAPVTLVTTTSTVSGVSTQTVNGIAFDTDAFGAGDVLTISRTFNSQTVTEPAVNQDDIVAPIRELTRTGTASAGQTAIGGTDRFGTARKIAKAYSDHGDTAIIVNGMNFPDALSSGFLAQREGAPILLTAQGFVPQDTLESLRERGVRKVYIVGGEAAVGKAVSDALKNTDAYMWDAAANNLKPRGSKLEVIQLGGSDRYVTNWVVNTYAAAQTANAAPVGKINVSYGKPAMTTALIARGDQFADALTANLLTAGLRGGQVTTGATAATVTVTRGFTAPTAAATQPQSISTADLNKFLINGEYFVDYVAANDVRIYAGTDNTGTLVATSTDGRVFTPASSSTLDGTVTFGQAWGQDGNFALSVTPAQPGSWQYDLKAARTNALPVILTPSNGLHSYSTNQLNALHIQHALLIGGNAALAPKVNDDIAAAGATSMRLEGKDRFDTARVVNEFAMADPTPKADNPNFVPGLGFDGGRMYDANNTPLAGNSEAQTDWVAYLANGMKFPDALVAGPWISYSRDAMLMTAGSGDLSDPSRKFLTDHAAQIDRAAGLGLGNAISSSVLAEANKLASSK